MAFFEIFWNRLIEIILAPAFNPDMFWIITPLIFTLLLMTFYFGAYRREEMGYSSAVANSIVLLFVGIDLFRYVFNLTAPGSILNYQLHPISALICLLVLLEAITLMFASFFRALPKQVTFIFCAPASVNIQAYLAIAIVYTNIKLDWYTLLAAVVLFIVIYLVLKMMQFTQRHLGEKIKEKKLEELEEEKKEAKKVIKEAEMQKKAQVHKAKVEKEIEKISKEKPKKKKKR